MKITPTGLTTEPDGTPVQVRDGRGPMPDGVARAQIDGRGELRERMRRAGSPTHGGVAPNWQDIKSMFVDDPAGALAVAEQLVQRALDDKIRALKDEAAALCVREREADEADTEALRTRLIRYQAYVDRLAGIAKHEV